MDSFRMRSRSSSIQDSWKPCFLHIALQHIYRIAPAKSGNVLYRWRSSTPKIPGSDGAFIIIVWKQCRFRKLQFQTCSCHGTMTHLMHWQLFFHVFFWSDWISPVIRRRMYSQMNHQELPQPNPSNHLQKNCKSSESYKASIIFYLKAFQKKCIKPGD